MFYLPILQNGQVVDALIVTLKNEIIYIFDRELYYKRGTYSFFRFSRVPPDVVINLLSVGNTGYYPYFEEVNEAGNNLTYIAKKHPYIIDVLNELPYLDTINPAGWEYVKGDLAISLDARGCAIRIKGRLFDTYPEILAALFCTTPRFLLNDRQGFMSFSYLKGFVRKLRNQEDVKFLSYRYFSLPQRLAL